MAWTWHATASINEGQKYPPQKSKFHVSWPPPYSVSASTAGCNTGISPAGDYL